MMILHTVNSIVLSFLLPSLHRRAQGGSGELLDSVKKAAFVIGSGILFLAAFGNSLTWYVFQTQCN